MRAAFEAIADEDVESVDKVDGDDIRECIDKAIATLRMLSPPEEDEEGTVSCACAVVGRLDLLVEARALGYPWDESTCSSAAYYGQLECLKYAREHGCPWDEETCAYAASNGHLECLKYAREHGCPWDEETCRLAALNGQLECLKYAREEGCPWDEGRARMPPGMDIWSV